MRPQLNPARRESGFALLMVLLFVSVMLLVLASTVTRGINTARLNDRSNQFLVNSAAAEAAVEKVVARINVDYKNGGDTALGASLDSYRSGIPSSGQESSYWTNFVFADPVNGDNKTYVVAQSTSSSNWTALDFEYEGLSGYTTDYRIVSNVRAPGSLYPNLIACVQHDVQTAEIPLFQFAIFYNDLLELVNNAAIVVLGPVHANDDFYSGAQSSTSTIFSNTVTFTGSISNVKYWAGVSNFSGTAKYYGTLKTNVTTLTLPIGTNNTAAAVREVIYPPPSTEDPASAMGQQRFFNKAQMVILVSNTTVKAWVKNGLSDTTSNLVPYTNMTYFLNTNVNFTDQREGKVVKTTQIDIGKFTVWGKTNAAVGTELGQENNGGNYRVPNLIYVADFRTNTAATMTGVRLTNGLILPNNNYGLTVATPQPLYVIGNYNCTNSSHLGTTNTSTAQPASFFCDAFTVLSTNWQDSYSTSNYTSRGSASTTINAAIVAGNVVSTGPAYGQYSGGVNNLPRLLESWSGKTLTLNTSLICLYNSLISTNIFIDPGDPSRTKYYSAPTRAFTFDINFKSPSKQPPGTPRIRTLIRVNWSTPPPGSTNYAGR